MSDEYQPPVRPVALAQASTSGQFHAGRPPTVQRGSGMTPLCRQMSTVGRLTPSRSATSAMPTGSQSLMPTSVEKVLTLGKVCVDNHYMNATDIGTTATPVEMTRQDWNGLLGRILTLVVEDSLDCLSTYSGRLSTIREGVGELVLADVTRTRSTGEAHVITRRIVPLCKVRSVTWLHIR